MPPKKNKKDVKDVKDIKKSKPKKQIKGGVISEDEPDTESGDDYLSEHSEEEIIEENQESQDETDGTETSDYEEEDRDSEDNPESENDDDESQDDVKSDTQSESDESVSSKDTKSDGVADEECLYKISTKKQKFYEDDDINDVEYFEDDEEEINEKNKYVEPENRMCKPFLFPFERVRLLGDRAKQISLGAKPMLENFSGLDAKEIAKIELKERTMPLILLRHLPTGKIEKWFIKELKQFN